MSAHERDLGRQGGNANSNTNLRALNAAYVLSAFIGGLGGCNQQGIQESSPAVLDSVHSKDSASQSNEDLDSCLASASSSTAQDWDRYCDSLSPRIRQTQCASYQLKTADLRRQWCDGQWSNQAPHDYHLEHMGPAQDRPCETPLQGEDVAAAVDDCCLPNPPPDACCPSSPVVLDLQGDGFDLTDAENGVSFDVIPNGTSERVAWTAANSDDAWLALDRNNNGVIDDGMELFGNYTSQRPSTNPNGFIALAVFDEPGLGGNGDSRIDEDDTIYAELLLWSDLDHNGLSSESELSQLNASGVQAIDLKYERSRLADEHGNEFRYRAEVHSAAESPIGKDAYDVFLLTSEPQTQGCSGNLEYNRCVYACRNGGTQAREAFCRSIADPRIRAGCWAIVLASEAMCVGFCAANFL